MDNLNELIFSAVKLKEQQNLVFNADIKPALIEEVFAPSVKPGKVTLKLVFTANEESLLLQGTVQAALKMDCARCAKAVTMDFTETFDEVYEDTVESIDVRELLIEALSIMPPMKPLCDENCKGLCVVCGGDLNKSDCGCKPEQPGPFDKLKDLKRKN